MSEVDVVGTGFTVLDRVYSGRMKLLAEELGGSCGNVLISLAMLRRSVAPVLSLGSDEVGMRLVSDFHSAGAVTRYISTRVDVRSPVLAQHLDAATGTHTFAFRCPETLTELPRYASIGGGDVEHALPVIKECSVFFTDRVSEAIVDAMETAAKAGSVVYFEPSEVGEERLFRRALAASTILKFSSGRLAASQFEARSGQSTVVVVTHGEAGLEVRSVEGTRWCKSHPAASVRDTCGAGDMVSVGIIDWLLKRRPNAGGRLALRSFIQGVEAGQRLAAENCGYIGARGLFRERGPGFARRVLEGHAS